MSFGFMIVLVVITAGAAIRAATGRARGLSGRAWFDTWELRRDGLAVRLDIIDGGIGRLRAHAEQPGLRLIWLRDWAPRPFFGDEVSGTNAIGAMAERAVYKVCGRIARRVKFAVMCDGTEVTIHVAGDPDRAAVELLADMVVMLARWDVAGCELLLALPDAEPLEVASRPTVSLRPDGVEVTLTGDAAAVWLGDHHREVSLDRDAIEHAVAAVRGEAAAERGYR